MGADARLKQREGVQLSQSRVWREGWAEGEDDPEKMTARHEDGGSVPSDW